MMSPSVCGLTSALFTHAQVLMDLLMGKRVTVGVHENAYWRTFGGEESPVDLDMALQLVHALFTSPVTPVPSELRTCMQ